MTADAPGTDPTVREQVMDLLRKPRPSRAERQAQGVRLRGEQPLEQFAAVPAAADRADAMALLTQQEKSRVPQLIALRHERMGADEFAFLRGAALIMAEDLNKTPRSPITVQLCGDAHVANFGMFASPERDLVFDLNDFDETNPGPFEWDVKRLAASVVVAGQINGHSPKQIRKATLAVGQSYREVMQALAGMRTMDVWFATLDFADLVQAVRQTALGEQAAKAGKKARKRTGDSAVAKLTEEIDGRRQFRNEPPVLVRVPPEQQEELIDRIAGTYARYVASLPADRIALLSRFSFRDIAHKVVGVGSVGTLAIVMLMESGDGEPLILQLKQAGQSVLEPYTKASPFGDAGQRVVVGQRVMQVAGDPFLGWCRADSEQRIDFYVRQLRDMKGAIETVGMTAEALTVYARICGAVLARAHARGGSPSLISGYLGDDDTFEVAVRDFALAYSDLNSHDYGRLRASVR